MKVDISGLRNPERKIVLSQFTLLELFQELHRRANQDVEEEGEPDWEDELEKVRFRAFLKWFPHFFANKTLFFLESVGEFQYAFDRLFSFFSEGWAWEMLWGTRELPVWLQEEILERRKGK